MEPGCSAFLEWLDRGGPREGSGEDHAPFLDHSSRCPACGEAFALQRRLEEDLSALGPDIETKIRYETRFLKSMGEASKPPEPFLSFPMSPRRLIFAFAGVSLVVLLVFRFFVPSFPSRRISSEIGLVQISGSGEVRLAGKTPSLQLSSRAVSLAPEDVVFLRAGESCSVSFSNGRWLNVTGVGKFRCGVQDLEVENGFDAEIVFSPMPDEFRVRMPTAVLGIRGTAIRISIAPGLSVVMVRDGTIEWKHTPTGRTGILGRGKGVRFLPREHVPFEPDWSVIPFVSSGPNGLLPSGSPQGSVSGRLPQPVSASETEPASGAPTGQPGSETATPAGIPDGSHPPGTAGSAGSRSGSIDEDY